MIKRAQRASFMNFAYKIIPTVGGDWADVPSDLANLTDGNLLSICGEGTADESDCYIEIDIGKEIELYKVEIHNLPGQGFFQAADGMGNVEFQLYVLDDKDNSTTLDLQDVPNDDTFYDVTLGYDGQGIKTRKIRMQFTPDMAVCIVQLSEIEVFGS